MNDPDLDGIKSGLLRGLRVKLTPQQGIEAFERHQLLVIRFHRAARLNDHAGDREGQGWCRFFADHFVRGDEHAKLLWDEWRTPLLKDETPGAGIAITHGHPETHWQPTDGGFCIDLESMWDDYEQSIDTFMLALAAHPDRGRVAVERWQARQWTVRPVRLITSKSLKTGELLRTSVASASIGNSPTAIAPSSRPDDDDDLSFIH